MGVCSTKGVAENRKQTFNSKKMLVRQGTKKFFSQSHTDSESALVKECEKAFKRQDLALAEKTLPQVQDPSSVKILYQPDWDRHCLNPRHFSFLHLAAGNGWLGLCKKLIRKFKSRPNVTDDMGFYTPLHFAVGGKHQSVIQYLLEEEKCDPHCLQFIVTPFQLACTVGNASIVDYFLSVWNCNPNSFDDFLNTPLHHAVSRGHLEVVLSLFATGEIRSLHCNKDGDTPLHIAARLGHYHIFVSILSHIEVNLSRCRNSIGDTPLHEAARHGHLPVIKYIMQAGDFDDIHVINSLGNTPLHEASSGNHSKIVELLLHEEDHCLLLHNLEGNTPLHLACKKGHLSTAQLLMNKGFDIHAKNKDNQSPIDVTKPIAKGHLKQLLQQK